MAVLPGRPRCRGQFDEAERRDASLEVCTVDPIAVAKQVARGRLPWGRLDDLLRGLLGSWVRGGMQMYELPSLQAQYHEHE